MLLWAITVGNGSFNPRLRMHFRPELWPHGLVSSLSIYGSVVVTGWFVDMLLVSRSGLAEEDAAEVFHYNGFHLSSSFLKYNFKYSQGK